MMDQTIDVCDYVDRFKCSTGSAADIEKLFTPRNFAKFVLSGRFQKLSFSPS